MNFMSELINGKLDAGYELASAEEQDISVLHEIKEEENLVKEKDEEAKEIVVEKIEKLEIEIVAPGPAMSEINDPINEGRAIMMPEIAWGYFDEIDKKANEFNITYEFIQGGIRVKGAEDLLEKLELFMEGLCLAGARRCEEEEEKKIDMRKDAEVGNSKGPYQQKEIKLSKSVKDSMKEIEDRMVNLEIIYENLDDRLLVAGYQENILEFLAWLYELTLNALEIENINLKEKRVFVDNNAFTQSEISISTFHRVNQQEITRKAEDMGILCEFGYDVLIVAGEESKIKDFKIYLHEVESNAKKALYPKYWDFHNVNMFSEIVVMEGSEEFQEVSGKFYQSLQNGVTIQKITRIQNKYLMDAYVTMLQKRQEISGGLEINRQLLFHGTRQIEPKKIYMSSDTGFDLQYSNPRGSYGKGIYFAVNSSYSVNGYGFSLGNGNSQIFLADVYVGKSFKSGPNNSLVKAPEGYDSVEATNSFYIVYNNFHSYPLYLIEYSGGGRNNNIRLGGVGGSLFPVKNPPPNNLLQSKPSGLPLNNNQNGLLFGNQQNNNQNNLSGGIFKGIQPLNNNLQNQVIFANQQQNNNNSGLFMSQQQPSGLFGSQQQQGGGGLFGNQQQQGGGGLFGNQQQQGGGLFGNKNNFQ